MVLCIIFFKLINVSYVLVRCHGFIQSFLLALFKYNATVRIGLVDLYNLIFIVVV